jgi:diguanylate cyclase (GGDEF)-like protein
MGAPLKKGGYRILKTYESTEAGQNKKKLRAEKSLQRIGLILSDPESRIPVAMQKSLLANVNDIMEVVDDLARKYSMLMRRFQETKYEVDYAKKRVGVDHLTNLPLGTPFDQVAASYLWELRKIPDRFSAVWFLDVAKFGYLNKEILGHRAGNKVLKQIAKLIREHIRSERPDDVSDLHARYGGDEFIALIPNLPKNEIDAISARLKEAIDQYPWDKEIRPRKSTKTVLSIRAYIGVGYCSHEDLISISNSIQEQERRRAAQTKLFFERVVTPLINCADAEMTFVKARGNGTGFSARRCTFTLSDEKPFTP